MKDALQMYMNMSTIHTPVLLLTVTSKEACFDLMSSL